MKKPRGMSIAHAMKPLVLAIAILGICSPAFALDKSSGNYWIKYCRNAININDNNKAANTDDLSLVEGNFCLGFVSGVSTGLKAANAICVPAGVTLGQQLKLVVREMDSYPEMLHKKIGTVVVAVMLKNWPCEQSK